MAVQASATKGYVQDPYPQDTTSNGLRIFLSAQLQKIANSISVINQILGALGIIAGATTVANLPAAGVVGRRAFVTDANAVTFQSIVAGGGSNKVPVFDDGTNWRIG